VQGSSNSIEDFTRAVESGCSTCFKVCYDYHTTYQPDISVTSNTASTNMAARARKQKAHMESLYFLHSPVIPICIASSITSQRERINHRNLVKDHSTRPSAAKLCRSLKRRYVSSLQMT